jgi:AcrR family transcriptional regulator
MTCPKVLNMCSVPAGDTPEGDGTARVAVREAALRLFAERGPDAVTVRDIAAAASVSPALVIHHYGSKAGLRDAVDERVARTFDAMIDALGDGDLDDALTGGSTASLADAFAAGFPLGSPLPAYLRRLLLSGDPTGNRLFARWYVLSETVLAGLEQAGIARPSRDRRVRAAFLLVNDLAAVLLARQIEETCGANPLDPEGMRRWAAEAADVYTRGAFIHRSEDGHDV